MDLAIAINPSIIVTALISTAAIFTCFSIASLTAKRGQWLYIGGTLMTFLTVLIGLSFVNLLFGSQLLFQVCIYIPMNISRFTISYNSYSVGIFSFQAYLYLGLALMCGFVLYDTQLIIEKCRLGDRDFILHSVDLFVDLLGIFRRLVIILAQKVSVYFLNYIIHYIICSRVLYCEHPKTICVLKSYVIYITIVTSQLLISGTMSTKEEAKGLRNLISAVLLFLFFNLK